MTDEVFREIASFLPPPVVRYYHEALDRELEPKRVRTKGGTLFLDMSGFTALTEKLAAEGTVGAEKISTVLNQHYEELLKIIDSFGGEVVKFAGDALVAIWPCPEVIPSLDRAAELVLVCATNIAKLQAVLEKKLGEVLKFKQGLAVGDLDLVYVGGVDEKWEFLIKGEALEHAVFAEGCASPGDIILSPKLFKLIATRVVAKSLSSGCYLLRDKKFNVRKHVTHPIELNGEVLTKLRSFLPPTVTNKIDARQLQYMGELRSVSVLFLNLPDIHSRAPLDRDQTVFQLVQDVVYSFDGEVNKLSVDDKGVSVIAVWGIPPRIAEGGGERAVRAAMGIQNKLSELRLRLAAGVTTGGAFCGVIGGEIRREYTVIGDVVNLAARLMQAASEGILVDSTTHGLTLKNLTYERGQKLRVKGKSQPVEAFRLKGTSRSKRSSVARIFFVGRKEERGHIENDMSCIEQTEMCRVVLVRGDAGMGKSHLVAKSMQFARSKGISAYRIEISSFDTGSAFFAWQSILQDILSQSIQNTSMTMQSCVEHHLADGSELLDYVSVLNDVLGLEWPESALSKKLTGMSRTVKIAEVIGYLLTKLAASKKIVVVIENLHWLDGVSGELTADLMKQVKGVVFILNSRAVPLPPPRWFTRIYNHSRTKSFVLKPLNAGDCSELIGHCLGIKLVEDGLVDMVMDYSRGNPLFIKELTMSLEDRGLVKVQNGKLVVDEKLLDGFARMNVPNNIHSLIMSRLDSLSPARQLVLKTASVIGKTFTIRMLREVYPVLEDKPNVRQYLDALCSLGFLKQESNSGELNYSFSHVLIRDAVYESMLMEQRKWLHKVVAQWLNENTTKKTTAVLSSMAEHLLHAGEKRTACAFFEIAATKFLEAGAYDEAARQFRLAMPILEEMVEKKETPDLKLRLASGYRKWAETLLCLDQLNEARAKALTSIDIIGESRPVEILSRFRNFDGGRLEHYWLTAGRLLVGEEKGANLESIRGERALAAFVLAMIELLALDPKSARAYAFDSFLYSNHSSDVLERSKLLAVNGLVAGWLGKASEAQKFFQRAGEAHTDETKANSLIFCSMFEAENLLMEGNVEDSRKKIKDTMEVALVYADDRQIESLLSLSADVCYFSGQLPKSMGEADKLRKMAVRNRHLSFQLDALNQLLKIQLVVGGKRWSPRVYESYNRFLRDHKNTEGYFSSLVIRGNYQLMNGDMRKGIAHLHEALVWVEEYPMVGRVGGYACEKLADAYLHLYRRAFQEESAIQGSFRDCYLRTMGAMKKLKQRLVLFDPAYHLLLGRFYLVEQKLQGAAKQFKGAMELGRQMGVMPVEAQAMYHLANHSQLTDSLRRHYLQDAQQLFWRMGCRSTHKLITGELEAGP